SKFIGNRLTSNDTPASIRKALSRSELDAVLEESDLQNYRIKYAFPYRFILIAVKQ
ncbi:MAG: methyltransferase, partial [candidate division Zixibacteria bacterium]|nr:methyltransferase [candidate division Zixibacteria bacterium]NIS18215.1 methyltransferase [candidate division Zixibacteria bacterium]NIS49448.1 methyltransferase [candidate division Zixibacteria bacterium]